MKTKLLCLSLIYLVFISCQSATKDQETGIKEQFEKMSQETKDFFNRDAKLRCSCLKEYEKELAVVFNLHEPLLNQLKKASLTEKEKSEIISTFLPVYAMYTECMSDVPGPSESVEMKIQEDLKKFSGASAPGGKTYGMMELLSISLIEINCPEYKDLVVKTNSWLTDMAKFMSEMSGSEIETDSLEIHSE